MSASRAGAAALGALIGAAAMPQAQATTVGVTWSGPDNFEVVGPPPESISFAPIAGVDGFLGISAGPVASYEGAWSLLVDLNGTWTSIYSVGSGAGDTNLDDIPPVSFAAGTLTGIEFMGELISVETMTNAVFSFDQVPTVPEPGSLPVLMTALGALGLSMRLTGRLAGTRRR